jgi:cytosine/adenosine deaminase-related metal-dependent hydrolase
MSAREALEIATLGGAKVLNRDDIGAIRPGMAADMVAFDLGTIDFAGQQDPVAALVFCTPATVNWSVINGRVVVREGQLAGLDLRPHVARHNRLAARLIRGE